MSHQRANSTSSISNVFESGSGSNPIYGNKGGMATASGAPKGVDLPASSPSSVSAPLSISLPRQRSFSSSLSLATSPRTFTGSSIISNPNNAFLKDAFAPISPTVSAFPAGTGSTPSSTVATSASQNVPVLHRRFSSSFNQLNQIAASSSNNGSQTVERGRRTSMFGGSSPPLPSGASAQGADTNKSTSRASLFRKFSTTGRSAGHPFDRNDSGPTGLGPQVSGNNAQGEAFKESKKQHPFFANAAADAPTSSGGSHLSAVEKLKPSQDKLSRSSSPMRSMILNGQMLD
ncbi:hypothetical protein BGZ67_006355 [Mortierella alpina]|nr:hypothetical protein BGZ67_006355 [Mortierella alpina]